MTAVSFSVSRGATGFKMSDVTIGANAPSGGDVEIRWNITDVQGKNMNDFELIMAVEAFRRWFETNGSAVGGNQLTGLTSQPSGPPN